MPFLPFVYGYPSSSPRAHCTPNKSVPTLRYTRRHGPIIIYTRLPAEGTYYPICMFPASSDCLIGISDAFSAFCLRVSVILPTCSLPYPQQKRAYSALHPLAFTEFSPLHFRRSSIPSHVQLHRLRVTNLTLSSRGGDSSVGRTGPTEKTGPAVQSLSYDVRTAAVCNRMHQHLCAH